MFVVFEGIDGSGKTTVSNLVVEQLCVSGLTVKHLRAEGKFVSSVSEAIRTLARDSRNLALDPRAEFLLYVARDVQLIEEALRDALRHYDVVIADRFLHTAEVLARYGRGLPAAYTTPILTAAAGGLSPDLVVLIDVDPQLARARRKASKLITKDLRPPSRKGLAGVGLQHRVRRGYLELAAAAPQQWFVANNEEALDATVGKLTSLIQAATTQGVPHALANARRVNRVRSVVTTPTPRTPHDALVSLRQWLDQRSEREPQVAAYLLSGLFGAEIDDLRIQLAERAPAIMLAGLNRLCDPVSWQLREQLATTHPAEVARSLNGVTAPHARAGALQAYLAAHAPSDLLRALERRDDAEAWTLREQLSATYPNAAIVSLGGVISQHAHNLRKAWFAAHHTQIKDSYELSRTTARAVHGVGCALAWEMRETAKIAAPIASLASINGLHCERSWTWREAALQRATKTVMETLRGRREEAAWRMRREVADTTKEAIDSIIGLADEEAWTLRHTYQDVWPSTVVKSLGPLADTDRGTLLVERQLEAHPGNISLLKHAAAIALGTHRVQHSGDMYT